MPEKILQLNEKVIEGQLGLRVRNFYSFDSVAVNEI